MLWRGDAENLIRDRFLRHCLSASVSPRLILALSLLAPALYAQHPNYDDDIRPIFARRCFGCHNAGQMSSGLSLESFSGVVKGGNSGDAVIAGRANASLLFKAIAREEGAPQMPLGQAKLPDAEINAVRDWIQNGLLENAASKPRTPTGPSLDYVASAAIVKPNGPPAFPESLPAFSLPETPRANPVTALATSPFAPIAAIAGHERIYLYDLAKRATIGELPFPEGIPYCLRFSRDGSILLAAGGKPVQAGRVVLYDVRSGKRLALLGSDFDLTLAADLSPDGKLVALGGPSKLVKVFSVEDHKVLYTMKKHTDWITAVSFSPDGARLATGDRAGGIFLWDTTRFGNAGAFADHKDSITNLVWRPDAKVLASASEDGQIVVWNVSDGFPVTTIPKAHTPPKPPNTYGIIPAGVLGLDFTPEGDLVSAGRDSKIKLWSVYGAAKASSPQWDAVFTKVASAPDGKSFVAGDFKGRVILWDGKQQLTVANIVAAPAPAPAPALAR